MKQKLGLACCLIKKPILLLLDEPSIGVDPISRNELWNMVKEFVDDTIAIIWSTAYLDEAEKFTDTLLLNEGNLLFCGTPHELYQRVAGRTFQIQNISSSSREVLRTVLKNSKVLDGVIQGKEVRIVIKKENYLPTTQELNLTNDSEIVAVAPRFEDAFIDILGKDPIRTSLLAESIQPIHTYIEDAVVATDLTKKFGDFTATNKISFTVKQGEIFGLLGPNGAGKSTTFKMMCGLLQPTEGAAKIMSYDWLTSAKIASSKLGYMAQKFSLYDNLGVSHNLNFFAGLYGLSGDYKHKQIEQMTEIFGLKQYLNVIANNLPFGIKQRLALACAVMHSPEVLFLDEPTSGIDPITRREFWVHINGLAQKGVTIIITTHFMDEAEYCDRIGLVYNGSLFALDTPDNLKNMVKSITLPKPTLEDAFIELINSKKTQK